jgi:hypothetical protein
MDYGFRLFEVVKHTIQAPPLTVEVTHFMARYEVDGSADELIVLAPAV